MKKKKAKTTSSHGDNLASLAAKYSKTFETRKEQVVKDTKDDKQWGNRVNTILGLEIETLSEEGDYDLRALPSKDPSKPAYITLMEHYIDHPGVAGGRSFSVKALCPRVFGNQCELCDHWDNTMRSVTGTQEQKKDKRKKLREKKSSKLYLTRPRHYMLVIPEGEALKLENVRVYPFGNTVRNPLAECMQDDRYGGDFANPVTGFPFRVTKAKTGSNPWDVEYTVKYSNRDAAPLSHRLEEIETLLESLPDIYDLAREEYQLGFDGWLYTNTALNEVMSGADPAEVRRGLAGRFGKPQAKEHRFDKAESKPKKKLPSSFDFDDEDEDDEAGGKYDGWTRKQLVKECKKRGMKTKSSYSEDQYREMLEDHDEDNVPL